MSLGELLPKAVKLYPQKEAIVCGNHRFDYRSFAHRAGRLANGLRRLGLKKGERVAILHENCHVFLEVYFAAAHLGVVLVPLNFRLASQDFAMILGDSQTKVLIAQGKFADKVRAIDPSPAGLKNIIWTQSDQTAFAAGACGYESFLAAQPETLPSEPSAADEDVAHLYYTSGTTGRPKGVMLTHKNVKSHALGTIAEFQLRDTDKWFHVAPLFHLADAWATFAITWVGGTHVIIPTFEAGRTLKMIEAEKITLSNLIPTMLNLMVNHADVERYDYSSLRAILSGGASIAPETVRKIIKAFKCDYVQTYGMTETSP